MQSVFKIIAGSSVRYIRAVNAASARVRAYKVWGLKGIEAYAVGHMAPSIGLLGYERAASTTERAASNAALRAMQKTGGPDNTGRSFYKVTERDKTKVNNKAMALMQLLGL